MAPISPGVKHGPIRLLSDITSKHAERFELRPNVSGTESPGDDVVRLGVPAMTSTALVTRKAVMGKGVDLDPAYTGMCAH